MNPFISLLIDLQQILRQSMWMKRTQDSLSFSTLLLLPFPISEASPSPELPALSLLVARAIARSHP